MLRASGQRLTSLSSSNLSFRMQGGVACHFTPPNTRRVQQWAGSPRFGKPVGTNEQNGLPSPPCSDRERGCVALVLGEMAKLQNAIQRTCVAQLLLCIHRITQCVINVLWLYPFERTRTCLSPCSCTGNPSAEIHYCWARKKCK